MAGQPDQKGWHHFDSQWTYTAASYCDHISVLSTHLYTSAGSTWQDDGRFIPFGPDIIVDIVYSAPQAKALSHSDITS